MTTNSAAGKPAESFLGQDHLRQIEEEAQTVVSAALARGA